MIIISCVSFFLILLYYFYTKNYKYWASKGIPYKKPSLIFGNWYDVMLGKQHVFYKVRQLYDEFQTPYFGIYIFNQPNFVIRSPELLKNVLVKDADKFINRQFAINESADPVAAHAMFSAKDQTWKNVRTKISPVFTSGKMKLMLPLMKECASDLNEYLQNRDGEELEIRNLTKKYAVDIISSCVFGINSNCLKNDESEIMKVATKLTDMKSFKRSFSIFSYMFAPKLVDIFKLTFLDKPSMDYLIDVFKNTYKERTLKHIKRNDLIDLLHKLQNQESEENVYKFNDIEMVSQAIVFFSAGNDTTSLIVGLTLYELALNPTIQDRLRLEIKSVFEKYGEFSYEAIQEMSYLDMVINESLRKYPLTSFLSRKSTANYTFEKTGFTLDKDIALIIPVAGLHYDPEYFPDPEKYDPERFSDQNKHNIKPYTYLPFGDGPRNCIGQRFGILVTKVALIYTLKDFTFKKTDKTPVTLNHDTSSLFIENKGGMYLKVVKI